MHYRSLFAVAVAALLAGPATAHAQSKKSPQPKQATPMQATPASATTTTQQLSVTGWIGYETGDLSGLQLRVDGVMPFRKLSPQIELSWVGSIGWSYLTHSVSAFGVSTDTTGNILKFVPAARFTMPVNRELSFYGDAGLGLYWDSLSADVHYPAPIGTQSGPSTSGVGLMFRFGVGAFYELNPKIQLGASLYLDPLLGDYQDTTFSIMAGALFRL